MSGIYENIAPSISLRNFKGNNIVQTIAFDRIPEGNIMKRNYTDFFMQTCSKVLICNVFLYQNPF